MIVDLIIEMMLMNYTNILHMEHLSEYVMHVSLLLDLSHYAIYVTSPSARVVLSTSYSDVTSRGRPNLGPYVSFPDVRIRRGRRKDVASTSRPNRTYE